MKINREGFPTIRNVALPLILILVALTYCALRYGWSWWVVGPIDAGLLYLIITIFWFFREPKRPLLQEDGAVFSPADGKVVVIEEVEEKEYFGDRRIQISVFMSVTNVHINWFPIGGRIAYSRY
ncbi:MAG: phosphatidylserine decarboxylase, partial [Tidjanibacter sp.]|nr:phosphatidylserine decarboxylase [Tidjanibacter sp.]